MNDKVSQIPQSPQLIRAIAMPQSMYERVRDVLKSAPYRDAEPLLRELESTCSFVDIPIAPNDG